MLAVPIVKKSFVHRACIDNTGQEFDSDASKVIKLSIRSTGNKEEARDLERKLETPGYPQFKRPGVSLTPVASKKKAEKVDNGLGRKFIGFTIHFSRKPARLHGRY
jgi:hypothetical protein